MPDELDDLLAEADKVLGTKTPKRPRSNDPYEAALRRNGAPESLIPTMVAIGWAESSGNNRAINPGVGAGGKKTKEYSVGPWQVNTLAHPQYDKNQLTDWDYNAKAALDIYKKQGLRAWGAFTDGRYKKYLGKVQPPKTATVAPQQPDELDSLLAEADQVLGQTPQTQPVPTPRFDKQGNPVTAMGGLDTLAPTVATPEPTGEFSVRGVQKAMEALNALNASRNAGYAEYLKQSQLTDSPDARKAYNDALTLAPDAFKPNVAPDAQTQPQPAQTTPQGQLRQKTEQIKQQVAEKVAPLTGVARSQRITLAGRRPNQTFREYFDQEINRLGREAVPEATPEDVKAAQDASPTTVAGREWNADIERGYAERYASGELDAVNLNATPSFIDAIKRAVEARKKREKAQVRIDAGERDLDVLLDEGLITPEAFTTAEYERKNAEAAEEAARQKFLAENTVSDTPSNFLQGVGAARFGGGYGQTTNVGGEGRTIRPDTQSLDDVLRKYGSAQQYYKEQERIKEEYKYRYMAGPSEFVTNIARSIAAAPAFAGQAGVIAVTDLNPWLRGVTAEQNPIYQALGAYRQQLEASRNPDLDQWYLKDLPDGLGQLASQAILAPFTGGASVLLPIAQGAVTQYDEATKAGAKMRDRNIATIVGGLAAVPEVLLNLRYIGKAIPKNQFTGLLNAWSEKLFGNLAKVLPEAEARELTKRTIGAFVTQAAKNGVAGFGTEATQEYSEDTLNKLVGKLTYKPEATWSDVFIPNADEKRGYFVAGLIGAFGGNVNLVVSKLSDSELKRSDEVLAEQLQKGLIEVEQAQTLAREIADEAAKRNVSLKPQGTVEQLVKGAVDRFLAENPAQRKIGTGQFETVAPIAAPETALAPTPEAVPVEETPVEAPVAELSPVPTVETAPEVSPEASLPETPQDTSLTAEPVESAPIGDELDAVLAEAETVAPTVNDEQFVKGLAVKPREIVAETPLASPRDTDIAAILTAARAENANVSDTEIQEFEESLRKADDKVFASQRNYWLKGNSLPSRAVSKVTTNTADDFQRFTNAMTPLQRGKVQKQLEKQVRYDGNTYTYRTWIESLVADGATIASTRERARITPSRRREMESEIARLRRAATEARGDERQRIKDEQLEPLVRALNDGYELREINVLRQTDGTSFGADALGVAGLDYARFLLGDAQPKVTPTVPEAQPVEAKPTKKAKEPWEMTSNEFLDQAEYDQQFRAQYVTVDGQLIKSSRINPSTIEIPPLGTWRLDRSAKYNKYGDTIEQLREIPVKKIVGAEDPKAEGREVDANRYAVWLKEGKTPPPIRAAAFRDGRYKISDGHRRVLAAQKARHKTMLAWVAPFADSDSPSSDTDLTHQIAVKQALKEGKPVPESVLSEYPDLAEKYAKKEPVKKTATTSARQTTDTERETNEEKISGKGDKRRHRDYQRKRTYKTGDTIVAPSGQTYFINADLAEKDKRSAWQRVKEKRNYFFKKNIGDPLDVIAELRSFFATLKQPSESAVRRAMILTIDDDYALKVGGDNVSERHFESSLKWLQSHPKSGLDYEPVIVRKFSTDFADVLITLEDLEFLINETLTEKELNAKALDAIRGGIKIWLRGERFGVITYTDGDRPFTDDERNGILSYMAKADRGRDVVSVLEKGIAATKRGISTNTRNLDGYDDDVLPVIEALLERYKQFQAQPVKKTAKSEQVRDDVSKKAGKVDTTVTTGRDSDTFRQRMGEIINDKVKALKNVNKPVESRRSTITTPAAFVGKYGQEEYDRLAAGDITYNVPSPDVIREFLQSYPKRLKTPLDYTGELTIDPTPQKPFKKQSPIEAASMAMPHPAVESRFTLRSVLKSDGEWVATDGHWMLIVKDDVKPDKDGNSLYVPDKNGQAVRAEQNGTFPNYRAVIPLTNVHDTGKIDIQPLLDFAAETLRVGKNEYGIRRLPKGGQITSAFVVLQTPIGDIPVQSEYLTRALQSLQSLGETSVDIAVKDDHTQVLLTTPKGHRAIVMPSRGTPPYVYTVMPLDVQFNPTSAKRAIKALSVPDEYEARKRASATERDQESADWQEQYRMRKVAELEQMLDNGGEIPALPEVLKSVADISEWDSEAYDKQLDGITLERNADGKILAPNGKVSKIQNERLAKVIRSKEFIEWFGPWMTEPDKASKVVFNRGSFSPSDDSILKSVASERAPVSDIGFFSQVEQTILDKMPNRATAEQVRGILNPQKTPGIKQDELDWLDIEAFLAENPRPTKDELLAYVRANNADVREVVKTTQAIGQLWSNNRYQGERDIFVNEHKNGSWNVWDADAKKNYGPFESADEAKQYAEDTLRLTTPTVNDTKFSQWQLEGEKSGYRELLLTLPPKADNWGLFHNGELVQDGFNSAADVRTYVAENNLKEKYTGRLSASLTDDSAAMPYKSSHFDEPNIVAHIRFNERTDADGAKVMFVEEVQSDWSQSLRKGNDVPDTPFKSTSAWSMLAFKRALRWAVENGFDKIAWTTGEQQAERYDLSKQVEQVAVKTWNDGTQQVNIVPIGGDIIELQVVNGEVVEGYKEFVGKSLEDVIGKDLAERVLTTPRQSTYTVFEGNDLTVGGEGMIGFYDNILPKAVNKYVKRFGGRVTTTTLNTTPDARTVKDTDSAYVLAAQSFQDSNGSVSVADLRSAYPDATENELRNAIDAVRGVPVHALDITPAMRESVMQGQPLFSKSDLRALARVEYASDLVDGVTSSITDDGHLNLSEHASEMVRRTLAELSNTNEQPFDGATITGNTLKRIARRLESFAADLDANGYDSKPVRELADNLKKTAGNNYSVLYVYEEALPEETVHVQDLNAGRTDAAAMAKLKESPFWANPGDKFTKQYPRISDADKASEIAAKLATDQASKYGWDKIADFEAEKQKFLNEWANGIIRRNLAKLQTEDQWDDFTKSYPTITQYGGNKKSDTRASGKSGTSGTDTKAGEKEGTAQTEQKAVEGAESPSQEEAQQEADRRLPADGKLKPRKTVTSLEERGYIAPGDITGENRYYQTISRDAAKAVAQERIERIGLAHAVAEAIQPAETVSSAEQAFRMEVAELLFGQAAELAETNVEASAAKYNDAFDVIATLAVESTAYGQAISQLANWTRTNPQTAVAYLARRRKKNNLDPLSPEQAQVIVEDAQQVAEYKEQLDKANEKVADLEADVERLDAAIAEAQETVNTQKRTLTVLRRLYSYWKNKKGGNAKRQRKTVRERIAELEAKKADALERLRERFGTDVLKSVVLSVADVSDWDSASYDRQLESIELTRNADGKILAPNGKVSKIQNERLAKVIRSKEFIAWFGDWINAPEKASKVVDDNGEPLEVIHATDADIEEFNPNHAAGWGTGVYFSQVSEPNGEWYGDTEYRVFLNLRNPSNGFLPKGANRTSVGQARIDKLIESGIYEEADRVSLTEDDDLLRDEWQENGEFANRVLREMGFDGVIAYGNIGTELEYVAFEPNQIKSIFNRGSFSPSDDSILKSVADEPITDDVFEMLADLAELGILEDKPYTDLMAELADVTNGAIEPDVLSQAHHAAMENIADRVKREREDEKAKIAGDPELQAKADALKATREIRKEHRQRAKDFLKSTGQAVNTFERELIARAKAQNLPEYVVTAAMMFSDKSLSQADITRKLRERYPNEIKDGAAAMNAATKAAKFRSDVYKELRDERAAKRAEKNEASGEAQKAKQTYNNAFGKFRKRMEGLEKAPPSRVDRIIGIRKGLMVSALSTMWINVVGGAATSGLKTTSDIFTLALNKGLARFFGMESNAPDAIAAQVQFRELLGLDRDGKLGMDAVRQIFREARAAAHLAASHEFSDKTMSSRAQQVLNENPEWVDELFRAYNSDIEAHRKVLRKSFKEAVGKEKIGAGVDAALDMAEYIADKANFLNRFQEFLIRNIEFDRALNVALANRGISLAKTIENKQWSNITGDDLAYAVRSALEVTYALRPKPGTAGATLVNLGKGTYKIPMMYVAPFANFIWNASRQVAQYTPGVGIAQKVLRSKNENKEVKTWTDAMKTLSPRDAANQIIGTSILIGIALMLRSIGSDDDDWKKIKVPFMTDQDGKQMYVDVGNWWPLTPFFWMANKINRTIDGKPFFSSNDAKDNAFEVLEAMVGINERTFDQTAIRLAESVVEGSSERAWYNLQKLAGEEIGIVTRPFKSFKDIAAFVDTFQKDGKENADLDLLDFPFEDAATKNVPFRNTIWQAAGAKPKKRVTGEDMQQPRGSIGGVEVTPALRIFGYNFTSDYRRKEPTPAIKKARSFMIEPKESDGLPEPRRTSMWKGQIYRMIEDAGQDTDKQVRVREIIDSAESRGMFTAQSADRMRSMVGKTPIQSAVVGVSRKQTGNKPSPFNQVLALANETELTELLRMVTAKLIAEQTKREMSAADDDPTKPKKPKKPSLTIMELEKEQQTIMGEIDRRKKE